MVTLVKRKLKTDLKAKITKRDNEGPFTVITGRINQENITILDMYAHNIYASKYVKKKTDRTEKKKKLTELTEETDKSTILLKISITLFQYLIKQADRNLQGYIKLEQYHQPT